MKINEQLATQYIKYYGDQLVNARSLNRMITTIVDGQYDTEVSVKRLVHLTCSDENSVDYIQHYAKRYDLVDYDNRVIYEFDGEQHFKFTEFYHNDYSEFISQRRSDIDKQRIAYQLGFDIVRVSGQLTIHELFNVLMRLNRQKGQSLFIRDDKFIVVSTSDLSIELDDVDMLNQTIIKQCSEINELKQQLNDYRKQIKEMMSDKTVSKNVDRHKNKHNRKINTLSTFIEEYIDKLKCYQIVPTKVLFRAYNEWLKSNNYTRGHFKYQTFAKSVYEHCKMKGIKYDSRKSTYTKYKYQSSLLTLLNLNIDSSLFSQRQTAIIFDNAITLDEIDQFEQIINSSTKLEDLTDRQIQMIMILYYDLNKSDMKQTFTSLFN